MEEQVPLRFTVKHGKQAIPVEFSPVATVAQLKLHLHEVLGVAPEQQKLLHKAVLQNGVSLHEAGLTEGSKVMLVLVPSQPLEAGPPEAPAPSPPRASLPIISASKESEKQRKRAAAAEPVLIERLEVLELPEKDYALKLLEKLRQDRGIRAIMKRYGWRVQLLKELPPWNMKLAGYNRNHGTEVAVKLRKIPSVGATEVEWQAWSDILDTMLHELTHCRVDEHPPEFYALYRQLHKELISLDWTRGHGTKLGGDLEAYNPAPRHVEDSLAPVEELDWQTATKRSSGQRLGGASRDLAVLRGLPASQVAGLMAEVRLSEREKELEQACGNRGDLDSEVAAARPRSTPLTPATAPAQVSASSVPPCAGTSDGLPLEVLCSPTLSERASSADRVDTEGEQWDGEVEDCRPRSAGSLSPCSVGLEANETAMYCDEPIRDTFPQEDPTLQQPSRDLCVTELPSGVGPTHCEGGGLVAACPICGEPFPGDASERFLSNHVTQCLQRSAGPPPVPVPASEVACPELSSSVAHPHDPPLQGGIPRDSPVPQGREPCPICGVSFPIDASERYIGNHVEQCLASSARTGPTPVSAPPPGPSEGSSCPICGAAFEPGTSERAMVAHVERCLG